MESPNRQLLNSWKEISAYLSRGVRTVQRWEAFYGMPVHRPAGHSRAAVVAFSDELDEWLRNSNAVRERSDLHSFGLEYVEMLIEQRPGDPAAARLCQAILDFLSPEAQRAPSGQDHARGRFSEQVNNLLTRSLSSQDHQAA
jgi:hypothetical protein